MADREGFEPPIVLRLCLISSLIYLLRIVNVHAHFASMISVGVTFGVTSSFSLGVSLDRGLGIKTHGCVNGLGVDFRL